MPDIFQLSADLGSIAKSIASADDKMKLAEVAIALNELALENRRLMEENAALAEKLRRRKGLEYRDGSYYVDEGSCLDGPICPECYLEKGLVYRLVRYSASGHLRCKTCRRTYSI